MRRALPLLALAVLLAAPAAALEEDLTRLLRFPDIQGDLIAFVYAGDVWTVPASGGVARRLTSGEGQELYPKISPDGRWIAFSAEYSGTRQVWVIPTAGGQPQQLTFYNDVGPMPPRGGTDYRVLDWTPDGDRILFTANRLPWGERMSKHFTIARTGGMEEEVGIPEGSAGDYSPDGGSIVYTPISREFRTWKRYRGGRAQDVWTWNVATREARQLTDHAATDNQPVWVGEAIYFSSDRDTGTLNLYRYTPATGAVDRVTDHDTWDVLWPSGGTDAVVYEAGGWIWRFDPATGASAKVPIRVYGDFEGTLPHTANVKERVTSAHLGPDGNRAVLAARGELFTVPARKGETRALTHTPGVRERDPAWSPDGRWIAYFSDATGEYELWVRPADGTGEPRQVTRGLEVWSYTPAWSPDGARIAFGDRRARLQVVDVATGRVETVDRGTFDDITEYAFSPDSRWLAYTKTAELPLGSIWVRDLDAGANHRLTAEDTAERSPAWDPEGRYLYFLSDRDFNLTFSDWEFDFLYTRPTRVYVGLLAEDGPALLLPESDEVAVAADEEEDGAPLGRGDEKRKAAEEDDEDEEAEDVVVRIDVAGFERRVRAIPGAPGAYGDLAATADGVLYLEGGGEGAPDLKLFDLSKREEKTVLAGVREYGVSHDRKKVLYRTASGWGITDAKAGASTEDAALDLDLQTRVVPREEWRQMFADGWRILRDWFYDPGMHGLDWPAMRAKYAPLVEHVASRADLDSLLGELGGELNAGHVYIQASPEAAVRRVDGGLLGAEIERDRSGYFRIAGIFPGENWHDDLRSPLTEPGVDVAEGDLILAVDGQSTRGVDNFYRLLEGKAERAVTLTVASAVDAAARTARVRPVKSEGGLRYLAWVESRREYVERLSGGRIGYIHLPNTAAEGSEALYRGFYPQAQKEALILDARYNGGGFIPFNLIETLQRPLLSYWARREVAPFTTPSFVHRGPKAVLVNGYSSSGGDAFPYYFRQRGLGPVIGTRTWGGLIGLSGNPDLMDGGAVLVPTFRFIDPETGQWAVEGEGVEPDIVVVDRPDDVARGIDPSLETAVKVLLEALETEAPPPLVVPQAPRFGLEVDD